MNCSVHPDVPAAGVCVDCGDPLCAACRLKHSHAGAHSSAFAGRAVASAGGVRSVSTSSSSSNTVSPTRNPSRTADHGLVDSTLKRAYESGKDNTGSATRSGFLFAAAGTALVAVSLFINARGYYFLALLLVAIWILGGILIGHRSSGVLSSLWESLVAAAVGGVITLFLALLLHAGRLAMFGVTGELQEMMGSGAVLGFFDLGGSSTSSNAGLGFSYLLFVTVAFTAMLGVGTAAAAVASVVTRLVSRD